MNLEPPLLEIDMWKFEAHQSMSSKPFPDIAQYSRAIPIAAFSSS